MIRKSSRVIGMFTSDSRPRRHTERRLAPHLALLSVIALCLAQGLPLALACDACSNDTCTPGFEQGTYGCSSGGGECSWIGRILGGCVVRFCTTQGSPPCDNHPRKSISATIAEAAHDAPGTFVESVDETCLGEDGTCQIILPMAASAVPHSNEVPGSESTCEAASSFAASVVEAAPTQWADLSPAFILAKR